jgi:hypothetical protein
MNAIKHNFCVTIFIFILPFPNFDITQQNVLNEQITAYNNKLCLFSCGLFNDNVSNLDNCNTL